MAFFFFFFRTSKLCILCACFVGWFLHVTSWSLVLLLLQQKKLLTFGLPASSFGAFSSCSHTHKTQYNKITWWFKRNCEYRNITWETGDLRGWRGWQVHHLSPSPAQHHSENGNMKTWCVLTTASVHCEVNPLTKTNLFLSPSLSFNNIWGVFICQTLKCKHIKSLWCDDEYAQSRLLKCVLSSKTTTLILNTGDQVHQQIYSLKQK